MRVQWILVVSVYEGPVDISGQCNMKVQWILVVSVYEGPVDISSQCI